MATNEPPQRKRRFEKLTPTTEEEGNSVEGTITTTPREEKEEEEEEPTYYILKEGNYVPVPKKPQGGYVPSSECESDDENVDPVLKKEYDRQIHESGGFDIDVYIRNGSLTPYKCYDDDKDEIGICAKLGLHWYNLLNGSAYRLLRVEKYNAMLTGIMTFYISSDVIDPASDSRFVFQTCVTRASLKNNEDFKIVTECCRIKPETNGSYDNENCHLNVEELDAFYKGDLKWLPDDALGQSSDKQHQYYECQDSDIRENDWLNLYAEYAYFPLWENSLTKIKFGAPLEITKVVVQTREAMEPKEKLKAKNAIFYISFRDCGLTEEHRAVVRRTTDEIPESVCLEVKCPVGDLSSCSIN